MIESHHEELFAEPRSSMRPKLFGGLAAILITALVFTGYTLLRKRHAEDSGSLALLSPVPAGDTSKPPRALIIVDEALLQGGKTVVGGIVRNTSAEKLQELSVELELKQRKGGVTETRLVPLDPKQLESQQEGRYSLELKAQDYSSVRLVALKAGPGLQPLAYTTAQGQKRPPERFEPKTIIVGRPSGKGGEFLNSPDNPARIP
ncbi:MAG: hypothetical protein ABJC10_05710 [Acidobacteriota bacterium]